MKALPSSGSQAQWDSKWIAQLGYIRKHLRYPISRLTALPVVMASVGIASMIIFLYLAITWQQQTRHKNWAPLMAVGVMALSGLVAGWRHLQLLRFIPVPSPHFSTENQALLVRFFQTEHLAFARHPEVPEVFQIISKPIAAGKEEREVLIFIADDHRILLNSHFTDAGWAAHVGHHKEMAKTLRKWLATQSGRTGSALAHS